MSAAPMLTRRALLKASLLGAGAVGFGVSGLGAVAAGGEAEVTSWIVIRADGRVVIRIPQSELGQGVTTSLAQLIAEEMDLAWGEFDTEYFDAQINRERHNVYVHTATLNSWSSDLLFEPMRLAGAQVKRMLLTAAAAKLKVEVEALVIEGARIRHGASGRSLGFAEVAKAAAALPVPPAASLELKDRGQWKLIGQSLPRLDAEAKATGAAQFGIDVSLPGMKYAAVRQSPVFGGRLRGFDASKVMAMPGVIKVVAIKAGPSGYTVPDTLWDIIDWQMDDAVAVIADSWWLAEQALRALPISWDEGANAKVDSATIATALDTALKQPGTVMRGEGDVDAALATAARTIAAEYRYPYMEHAPLEPMNATALVTAQGVEAWAPSQYADEALRIAAYAAQRPLKDVKLHLTLSGGGFGRRLSNDYVSQAVQVAAQLPNVPVKLIASREETTRRGYYAPVAAARMRGGLDAEGRVVAWHSHVAFGRAPLQPYGMSRIPFAIDHVRCEYSSIDTPPPFGWMRGVAHTQGLWMNLGFLGELAEAAGKSSIEMQFALLDESRLSRQRGDYDDALARIRRQKSLLETVVKLAGGARLDGPGMGRGIAVTDMSYVPGYHSSCVAMAMDVALDGEGRLRVERVIAVVDVGLAINPRNVEAQVQGGIAFGLSNAMYGQITLRDGRVEQGNFNDYPVMKMMAMPHVEVHIQPSSGRPSGIGEEAVPVAVAALVDAVYAAGGPRVRSLPLAAHKLTPRKA
ncbi:MAG: xanthine dehydrogenase family protein molybdopterin-binding subunit [Proteobacteria bacterium]|nr:xanthine dehydrogenase family protein molybdopterin-binding subunit [Pseudomonadota bacterium]